VLGASAHGPKQDAAEPIAISEAKELSTATASTVAAEWTARAALAAHPATD
jgi:hypothetical protein